MLYQAYQAHTDLLAPLQMAAQSVAYLLRRANCGSDSVPALRNWAAACEVFSRLRMTHHRPHFGIESLSIREREIAVSEEAALATPFGTLLHFKKAEAPADQPRVLVVAPLSGHFATLLRDTVRALLEDHDVYITDWHNVRFVPWHEGRFGLDEYIDHVIRFIEAIGPGSHLLAVCQPCVPALAAVAVMAAAGHPAQPRSMTLMAGPVDTRINPTEVNRLATGRPIEWFERNLVHAVPLRYAGAMRRVYPGFLQLAAFVGMNAERHARAFADLYRQLSEGEEDQADATAKFYEEYFAVNDLAAEFYLETVQQVFQEFRLARGELYYRGERVEPAAIRRTALFTVEGERDDICAIGQTLAAHDLCAGIRPHMKSHHVQTGVGHYGVFSGRRWQQQIYPRVRELIHVSAG